MASNAITKAIHTLERQKKTQSRKRTEEKHTESKLTAAGAGAAGVLLGAALDRGMGGESGAPAQLFGLPQNILVGAAGVLAGALLGKGLASDGIGGAGMGLLYAGLYRVAYDAIDPGEFFPDGSDSA